jgi:hypothetical protein
MHVFYDLTGFGRGLTLAVDLCDRQLMATLSAPNRTILAVVFLAGGALQILGALVGLANAGNSGGFYLLSNLAIGAAFALMIAWYATTTLARVGYFIAALGWLLLALTSLINLGVVGTVAVFIAVVGSLFAAVIVISSRPFAGQADILLFVGMIVGAVNLLLSQYGAVPNLLRALIVVVFGALLVVASLVMLGRKLPSRAA